MSDKNLRVKKVVVVFGLIASGKSYLAQNWANSHGFYYYNTDIVRKKLARQIAGGARQVRFGNPMYSRSMSGRTYDTLINKARADLERPKTQVVVLDGSFGDLRQRRRVVFEFGELAEIYYVYCFCSDRCRQVRLKERAADPNAVSDGRWEIYQEQKKQFCTPLAIAGTRLLELDTERSLTELTGTLDVFIGLE